MKLSIIIVNFNTSDLLRNCVNRVYKSLNFGKIEKDSEVIVVDNASTDASVEMVEKKFPKVILIKNEQNLGFSKANNQGIRKASGKYILLLNSDTEVDKEALIKLVDHAEKETSFGAMGAKILNFDKSIQYSLGFAPTLPRVFYWMTFIDNIPNLTKFLKPYHIENSKFYTQKREVDWVSGVCILVPRKIIAKIGKLDENIFMYGEEVEWCYRIKNGGLRVIYNPEVVIYHHKGSSGGGKDAGIIEEFGSLIYFYSKYRSLQHLIILKILLIFGALLRTILFGIIVRNLEKASIYVKAVQMVR